jgi:Icc protein
MTRIALCTDTHNWMPPPGNESPGAQAVALQYDSPAVQAALLDVLRAEQPDLVVHLGDFTCGGGYFHMPPADFVSASAAIRHNFAALPMPVYALPGNHDCVPGGGDWRVFEELWGLRHGLGHTVDLPAARLVLVHSQGHSPARIAAAAPSDPVYGWVGDAELARLDAALAGAGDRPVILFLHQLLIPWSSGVNWLDYYGTANGGRVLEIMDRHANVRAVFQGHAHLYDVQERAVGGRPCRFVVAPAVIDYPVGWLDLHLDEDCLQVTLRQLPLPDLIERSRDARPGNGGASQEWRAGRPEWSSFVIDLTL